MHFSGHILQKNVLLKFNIQSKGHLDAYFLIDILTIYREYIPFQSLGRGICKHIPILTVVEKGHIIVKK